MRKREFDAIVKRLEKAKLPKPGEVLVATQFGFKSLPPDSPLILKDASA